ncbi:MAG TPA: SbmA/BacA-like family transporter [Gemmataceae bacterium]|nr:SbmA/BacA-like family transporter [Gemmataceae bacterium]
MRIFKHPLLTRFVLIARPFFVSEDRLKAAAVLGVMVFLGLTVNSLNVVNSYVMRDFMTSLEQRHFARFYFFGAVLAGVFGLATIGEAFSHYAEQRLGLFWREWLTGRLIDRYLAHRAYHRLTVTKSIDNPDERISEDVKTFTTSSLSFFSLILNGILALCAFLGVLWSLTPWLVLAAVLYSAAGSLGTILLGWRLVPLNNKQLQKEADFRYALVRVREQGGPDGQRSDDGDAKASLLERFKALVANFRSIIRVMLNVDFFTKEYNYLIQVIPVVVAAPLYFHDPEHFPFGKIPQAAMAFGQVVGAFSLIVTQYQVLSTLAAVIHRLGSMWEATESTGAPAEPGAAAPPSDEAEQQPARLELVQDNERVAYEKLTLWNPEKRVLIRDLNLEVPHGRRLIVSGPSGSGKTALALASAGLWGEGRGTIRCPGMGQIMFLPQQLYAATGRLRDLLLEGLDHHGHNDEQLREALREVGLDHLTNTMDGLDTQWYWIHGLLPGDQHALALARLLLAKPRFAILDGVPWALSAPRVQRLYEALARTPITYISIGDAEGLMPYHDVWLELLGEGRWRLRQANKEEQADAQELQHSEQAEP